MKISPVVGVSRRAKQRNSVLLPDPLGPMTETTSPFATSIETLRNTSCEPKLLPSLSVQMSLELRPGASPISFATF